jgi:hypothetical protein
MDKCKSKTKLEKMERKTEERLEWAKSTRIGTAAPARERHSRGWLTRQAYRCLFCSQVCCTAGAWIGFFAL